MAIPPGPTGVRSSGWQCWSTPRACFRRSAGWPSVHSCDVSSPMCPDLSGLRVAGCEDDVERPRVGERGGVFGPVPVGWDYSRSLASRATTACTAPSSSSRSWCPRVACLRTAGKPGPREDGFADVGMILALLLARSGACAVAGAESQALGRAEGSSRYSRSLASMAWAKVSRPRRWRSWRYPRWMRH